MKVLFRISLFFSTLCIGIGIGIFGNQWYSERIVSNYESGNSTYQLYSKEDLAQLNKEEDLSNTSSLNNDVVDDDVVETAVAKNVIDSNTIYVVVSYNIDKEMKDEEVLQLPGKYIGMDREMLEKELNDYTFAPTLRDQEKGFVSCGLQSFSAEKIVIEKKYSIPETMPFYITVEDNVIVVYETNVENPFLITEIKLSDLPNNIQAEVMNTKYMQTEEEVYDFLESYSS